MIKLRIYIRVVVKFKKGLIKPISGYEYAYLDQKTINMFLKELFGLTV